jgi:lysophospholipid acyltransferase (LPLAT)-like uncharacterized protein
MRIRVNPKTVGGWIAAITRAIGWTLRIRIEDHARVLDPAFKAPLIWIFWHNRMFVLPLMRLRVPHRTGAVLTSASSDGEIIAAVMERFGLVSVRGSTSRRGATALLELAGTPDGPRGPCYKLGPGVVFLARQTGAAILPVHVEYACAIRLGSWDRMRIPLPFSVVKIILDQPVSVSADSDMEIMREKIESLLVDKNRN